MNNLIDASQGRDNKAVPYTYVPYPKCMYRRDVATNEVVSRIFADEAELAQSETEGTVWCDSPAKVDDKPFDVEAADRAQLIAAAKAFGFDGDPPADMTDDAIRAVVRDAMKPKTFGAPAPADDGGKHKGKGAKS